MFGTLYLYFPVFHSIEKQVAGAFHAHIQIRYGVDLAVAVEQPRQSDFGEMAVPAAFQLAKHLRQAPKKIAAELVEEIGPIPGVAAHGSGRQRLHQYPVRPRRVCARRCCAATREDGSARRARRSSSSTPTSIPTRRRTSAICATPRWATRSCACCARAGERVEVQNYIDNTGVQVADVVVGFHYLEHKTPADVARADRRPGGALRLLCWDLYARTSQLLQGPSRSRWRGAPRRCTPSRRARASWPNWRTWWPTPSCSAHLATMLRLDVEYDVLPRESEILHLQFWAAAFELLKERKAIYFETEGKNAGCWVMPARLSRRRHGRQQGDRALRRHGHVCRQGHRLPALEVRPAGQGFLLPAVAHAMPTGASCGSSTDEPQPQPAPAVRARARASTT